VQSCVHWQVRKLRSALEGLVACWQNGREVRGVHGAGGMAQALARGSGGRGVRRLHRFSFVSGLSRLMHFVVERRAVARYGRVAHTSSS
jgi:hypothetical protein